MRKIIDKAIGAIVDFLDGFLGRGCAMAGIKPVYSGFP